MGRRGLLWPAALWRIRYNAPRRVLRGALTARGLAAMRPAAPGLAGGGAGGQVAYVVVFGALAGDAADLQRYVVQAVAFRGDPAQMG